MRNMIPRLEVQKVGNHCSSGTKRLKNIDTYQMPNGWPKTKQHAPLFPQLNRATHCYEMVS